MTCPICQYDEFWPIASAQDALSDAVRARHGESAPLDWRLCKRCGNAYPLQPPKRKILQALWALNRSDENANAAEKEKIWSYRRAIARVGAERSYQLFAPLAAKPQGRFLDIGCGLGETVRTFASHGWDAEGIDADPSTAPIHREIGIKARIGQFEDFVLDQRFDLIQISHAIYFVTDPIWFLRNVRERLAPGGMFCIVLADFLAHSDPGRPTYAHTFYPTGHSMQYALSLAGFETVLSKALSGSIYIAARAAIAPRPPRIWPAAILLLYRTKKLRYTLIGRPYLALRRAVKALIGRG